MAPTARKSAATDDWETQTLSSQASLAQKHRASHVVVAALTQLVAVFLYVYVYGYDVKQYGAYVAVVSAASVYLLQFAYSNNWVKLSEKEKKEIGYRQVSGAVESVLEAKTLAQTYFWGNALFVGALCVCGFFLFRTTGYPFNLIFGNLLSAGLPAFISTGSEGRKTSRR
eukprot:TRINITY_DN206_c0_g1_i1.p1 TRINITY_DN206_c0_g1~~TRINITY_DN206_c0_g1_i1.p1  ORF type:complete len:170 (-),score=29.46 TRINITY_DN206_c0_g1_i1:225-734(-)